MALTPSVTDPHRKELMKRIADLKNVGTPEAEDTLKGEFNIGDMSPILPATPAAITKVNETKK
jgi:hypothetical protein